MYMEHNRDRRSPYCSDVPRCKVLRGGGGGGGIAVMNAQHLKFLSFIYSIIIYCSLIVILC